MYGLCLVLQNQLLAALVLIALAVFLKTTGRTGWTLYIPMFVMLAVTFTALIQKTIALVSNIAHPFHSAFKVTRKITIHIVSAKVKALHYKIGGACLSRTLTLSLWRNHHNSQGRDLKYEALLPPV